MRKIVAVDFETTPILPRPEYPPVPVGVAIYEESCSPFYMAWAHPSENTHTFAEAYETLRQLWSDTSAELLFHNAAFDLDVAETHMGLALPDWTRIHDTQILAFLAEPEGKSTALKPLAYELLNMPPDEQDELHAWIRRHVPEARQRRKNLGEFIARAPGRLVGKYAVGDVVRTLAIFDKLQPWVVDAGIGPAYDRDRRLIRVQLGLERRGVCVDSGVAAQELELANRSLEVMESWLHRKLGSSSVNLSSHEELADRLEILGIVRSEDWIRTWRGTRQTSNEALRAAVKSPRHTDLLDGLRYYTLLRNIRTNQLEPWSKAGGRIFCRWNSTRRSSESHGRSVGARTGRLSSSPNFQNIPARIPVLVDSLKEREYKESQGREALILWDRELRECHPIPHPREMIIPTDGYRLIRRDYSQQEPRILAHFAGGALLDAYVENPKLDVYTYTIQRAAANGVTGLTRPMTKTVVLGVIYGQSVGALAGSLGVPFEKAQDLRKAVIEAMAPVSRLMNDLRIKAAEDQPFRTWGGRLYWCEQKKIVKGQIRTFEYKMLNTLMQGSAGDHIKETMVRIDEELPTEHCKLLLTAHDEVLSEAPVDIAESVCSRQGEIMESIKFKVPMLSEGSTGENWEVCK